MVTTQMKTDAQRFGNGKKGFNVKQVEDMLENAGGGYTAGTGIEISESKEISVADTVAMKTDIPEGFHLAENLSDVAVRSEDNKHWIFKHNTIFIIYPMSIPEVAISIGVFPKGTVMYDDGSTFDTTNFAYNYEIYSVRLTELFIRNPFSLNLITRHDNVISSSNGIITITEKAYDYYTIFNIYNENYNNQKNKIEIYIGD